MSCVNSYFISWILGLLIFDVQFIHGLNVCRGDQISNVSLPTELQSEVLLPCFFESDFLNSNQTNESCVVWTHLNSTKREIVEISLDGDTKFWNNRRGRIKAFPKLLESELLYFSIQIRNVQQSDLGVYHCSLFRENCLLAYKRIELHNEPAVTPEDSLTWLIPTGAAGGAALLVVLLVLLVVACKFFKRQENNIMEPVYENTSQTKYTNREKFTNENRMTISNPIYN
ncbi:uncharacterized protein LOC132140376 [Carassius carassius]|uniref:uncharacterized protein LOC132140376 n=1 Tax=Carassius carassius TaxID=217509 RepID=UPI00286968EB|nr:uncharacterized protein LOC132140376 [Carassius carassius]